MDNDDFSNLLRRAINGEAAATSELLKRCEPEIQKIVRAKLPRKIRSKFDSMDFVQAVWKSVLTKDSETSPRFEGESHFVRYVAVMARNKVVEQFRRHTKTGKYNIALEEPLYITRGDQEILRDLPAPDPTPSQDAQAADRLARMQKGMSPQECEVLRLRGLGLTYVEIGERLGIGEASARRIVDALRKREETRGWE